VQLRRAGEEDNGGGGDGKSIIIMIIIYYRSYTFNNRVKCVIPLFYTHNNVRQTLMTVTLRQLQQLKLRATFYIIIASRHF